MSENVDLVRSICSAWERGDFASAAWADPDIEGARADGPAPSSWRGLSEMAQAEREFLSAWENYRVDVEEYRELDSDRVLVLLRHTGRGRTSGVELGEMQSNAGALFQIRDGKVSRLILYWDGDRALADLGLKG
jgi:ketosteroid isomerase-like protein